jgi:nucleotide-binding universal stress UspA family protein
VSPLSKILVGTDTSARAEMAVEEAVRLARAEDAELVVLYVKLPVDAREVFDPGKPADPIAYLHGLAARFEGVRMRTRIEEGDPAPKIVEIAAEEGARLVVLGNREVHERRWLLGSIPLVVATRSPCSVYIVDTRAAA